MRQRSQDLLTALLPRLAVARPAAEGHLDPRSLFETPLRAVWLEVGFGGGEHAAEQAAANPDVGILASEVFVNGVASLLNHCDRMALRNIRIFADDVRHLFPALPDACAEKIFVLFPDPWPKTRHAERRFIGPDNMPQLSRLLIDGGELRVASDDPTYIGWALGQLGSYPDFELTVSRGLRPEGWPPTRYEAKAIKAGRECVYMSARRRPR